MASSADRRTWVWLSWLVATPLLAGCEPAADLPSGGQSGTEGGGLIVCEPTQPRSVSPDEVLPYFESSLNELSASLSVSALPGLWLSTGTRAELSVSIAPDTRARQISYMHGRGICHSVLELEALTVRSSDGAIDAQVPARLTLGKGSSAPGVPLEVAGLEATLTLPDGYVGPAVWPPDEVAARNWLSTAVVDLARGLPRSGPPVLSVLLQPGTCPLDVTAIISEGDELLGLWTASPEGLPSGPPDSYTPNERFAAECAGAGQFRGVGPEYTPFSSVAAALAGVAGTWVRCLDPVDSSHAGLRILPDGSWQDFTLEGDEPVARFGFEHEGFLHVYDSRVTSHEPGSHRIDLLPFGRDSHATNWDELVTWASEDALVFNSPNEGWPKAVYLRTSAPVRTAAPEYADGERAGAAACQAGEQGIVSTLEESAALLRGDFVLCSGALRGGVARLHFDESNVTLLREDGTLILEQHYERDALDAPRLSLVLRADDPEYRSWVVVVSRSPRKLWIHESGGPDSNVAVFSALP